MSSSFHARTPIASQLLNKHHLSSILINHFATDRFSAVLFFEGLPASTEPNTSYAQFYS